MLKSHLWVGGGADVGWMAQCLVRKLNSVQGSIIYELCFQERKSFTMLRILLSASERNKESVFFQLVK